MFTPLDWQSQLEIYDLENYVVEYGCSARAKDLFHTIVANNLFRLITRPNYLGQKASCCLYVPFLSNSHSALYFSKNLRVTSMS